MDGLFLMGSIHWPCSLLSGLSFSGGVLHFIFTSSHPLPEIHDASLAVKLARLLECGRCYVKHNEFIFRVVVLPVTHP